MGELQLHTVGPWLIDHGYVSRSDVVANGIAITAVSRRNANFKVAKGGVPLWFVKSSAHAEFLAHEAQIYSYLKRIGALEATIPSALGYDDGVLITRLIEPTQTLRDWLALKRDEEGIVARQIGEALGELAAATRSDDLDDATAPWIFEVERRSVDQLARMSAGELAFVRCVQQLPELLGGLHEARQLWRPACLCHKDLKGDNILVDQHRRPVLIDWEFAAGGDELWDLATVVGDTLTWWLLSIPTDRIVSHEQFAEAATVDIEDVHGFNRSTWSCFWQARRPDKDTRRKVSMFIAARLVQTACEYAMANTKLTRSIMLLVQVAQNMFAKPLAASELWLGE